MSEEALAQKQRLQADIGEKEKKDRQVAIAVTLGTTALLLLFSLFWSGRFGQRPLIEEMKWETIGRVDFGTDALGALNVNNFEQPSPTPADRPQTTPKPEPVETPPTQTVSSPPAQQDVSTTETQNVVQENTTQNPPKVENNTKPTPKTNNTTTENQSNPNKSDNNPSENAATETGGSNQGDAGVTGNRGNPNANVLDDKGMFEFGEGIGGPGGRSPVDIPLPKYNIQKEGRVTYTFIILPSGETANIRAKSTPHMDLAEIGKRAIEQWRFSETDPGAGNLRTSVTITFRLK